MMRNRTDKADFQHISGCRRFQTGRQPLVSLYIIHVWVVYRVDIIITFSVKHSKCHITLKSKNIADSLEGIVHGTHTLKINDFQWDDSGRYRCIAATAMGTGQSQERQIPAGMSVSFTCILTSGPMVEIQYMYFHEQQIPVSHFLCTTDSSLSFAVYIRFLSVTGLYEQQIGRYRCIAATAMGTGQSQERQIQMIGMS
jgi:hypothetical protein